MRVKPRLQRKIKLWCNYTPCANRATARLNTSGWVFGSDFFAMEVPIGWETKVHRYEGDVNATILFYCPEHNSEDKRKP